MFLSCLSIYIYLLNHLPLLLLSLHINISQCLIFILSFFSFPLSDFLSILLFSLYSFSSMLSLFIFSSSPYFTYFVFFIPSSIHLSLSLLKPIIFLILTLPPLLTISLPVFYFPTFLFQFFNQVLCFGFSFLFVSTYL